MTKVIIGAIAAAAAALGGAASGQSGSTWATISDGAKIVQQVSVGANIATDFAGNIIKGVNEHLLLKGYSAIEPGTKHTWGPMTLSLWQQGTCVRSYAVDNTTVRTETLYMRRIFSGSLANSNRDHDIAYWINKWGVESTDVVKQQ
ncbi:TPA: hypothetical protein N0F65_008776 [Lagenidium giganteum]|uniref:Uncharacterized protein n=1 Tax=Lagenidium giganteum TaxID=4803 RepID=A0AAV2Z2K6_9STRA|nr:TPA: hypothetical protein N0F65_008776 [Lagenidium giganteum]